MRANLCAARVAFDRTRRRGAAEADTRAAEAAESTENRKNGPQPPRGSGGTRRRVRQKKFFFNPLKFP